MSTNFPGPLHTVGFVGFFRAMGNLWENPCISYVISIPQDGNRMGKKHPYYGKKRSTNLQSLPHTMGFVAFSRTMANWWENPCISYMMKYTIGWELDGKKLPILRERYDYQFPRFSPHDGFCCIFPYYGKLMGKPMHFPYDKVYHRMGIG